MFVLAYIHGIYLALLQSAQLVYCIVFKYLYSAP